MRPKAPSRAAATGPALGNAYGDAARALRSQSPGGCMLGRRGVSPVRAGQEIVVNIEGFIGIEPLPDSLLARAG